MRIAIDASRTTLARRTGTERYALALLQALLAQESEHEFTLYFRDTPAPGLLRGSGNVRQRVVPVNRLWTHVGFAAALWQDRPDVTFVPAHTLPLMFPGPAVVTVHDLGYRLFPQAYAAWPRWYLDRSTAYSVRRSSLVLADSQATADDLAAIYAVPPERIRVVYPGVDPTLSPVSDPARLAALRDHYGLPERYLLFLGTLQPRKNIARLVQAYRESGVLADGIGLVLAGAQGWLYDPEWTAGVNGVQEIGYVADADIAALYSAAEALVFPSLHEGFGFPALEAMRCGTPVILSNTSSLPEVGGEAALQVDPLVVEAIAGAIRRVVDDPALRVQMIAAGFVQAARFTWEAAARQTLAALEFAGSGS